MVSCFSRDKKLCWLSIFFFVAMFFPPADLGKRGGFFSTTCRAAPMALKSYSVLFGDGSGEQTKQLDLA